jgi:catechol 2,3-dioxygenase-like lactoylglutathione lyase family enzyme
MSRRLFVLTVALALAFAAPAAAAKPVVDEVVSVGMTVRDADAAIAFYRDVLAFEKVADVEVAGREYEQLTGVFGARVRIVHMKLGEETLELTEFLAPRGRPIPVDSRSNDGWFQHIAIVVSDMDAAYRRLRKHKVEHASTGPQTLPEWNKAAGGIKAFYFKDPDGHVLEVIQFPPGKGDKRWQKKSDRLFLGIDHTAIVVRDTEKSLALYRNRLGLKVAGESENHGTEQEHLNNVFGAKLRITSLRAEKGPGIELLEYLAPRDGRPMPRDTKANDLWHWQIRLRAAAIDRIPETVRGRLVSPGLIAISGEHAGFSKGLLARDPDGHALLFGDR